MYHHIAWMNKGLFLYLALLVISIFTACTANVSQPNCDPKSEIVSLLNENYDGWAELAKNLSLATNGVATISVDGHPYAVRVLQFTSENTPILSVSTNEGLPRTWIGKSGYFYSPNGEKLNLTDDYVIEQITGNIYCYWSS